MLDNIRKIQQRAASIESKYSEPTAWLDSAHTSYLDAIAHQWSPNIRRDEIAHQCPTLVGRTCFDLECLYLKNTSAQCALPASPCLDLECQGFDTREQKK